VPYSLGEGGMHGVKVSGVRHCQIRAGESGVTDRMD